VQGIASSNSFSSAGTYAGVKIDGCTNGIFDFACTQRNAAGHNADQLNSLRVLSTAITCTGNQIRLTHGAAVGATVGTAVSSDSALGGGNSLFVNGSGLGTRTLAAQSGTVTHPDPYIAMTHEYSLTGNVTTIGAPANQHLGCELELTFIQDGTGSRTATGWNATYKFAGSAPTLTTTANRRDTFRFRSNGTNWYEVNRSTNVLA